MAKAQQRVGTIYFLGSFGSDDEYFKIGYSDDFPKRLATIRYSVPFDISVIATIDGTREQERKLHRQLREFRLRGEWYSLPNKIAWGILESFGRKILPLEAFGAKGEQVLCYLRYRLQPPDEAFLPLGMAKVVNNSHA